MSNPRRMRNLLGAIALSAATAFVVAVPVAGASPTHAVQAHHHGHTGGKKPTHTGGGSHGQTSTAPSTGGVSF